MLSEKRSPIGADDVFNCSDEHDRHISSDRSAMMDRIEVVARPRPGQEDRDRLPTDPKYEQQRVDAAKRPRRPARTAPVGPGRAAPSRAGWPPCARGVRRLAASWGSRQWKRNIISAPTLPGRAPAAGPTAEEGHLFDVRPAHEQELADAHALVAEDGGRNVLRRSDERDRGAPRYGTAPFQRHGPSQASLPAWPARRSR